MVEENLLQKLGVGDKDIFMSEMAEKIVQKLRGIEQDENNEEEEEDIWDKTDVNDQVCIPCQLYIHKAPQHLKTNIKSSNGTFKKPNSDNTSTNRERRKRIRLHKSNPLHLWCSEKKKMSAKTRESEEKANFEKGQKIVENAIFCLLNSRSAKDYVKLNSKDQLSDPNFPT